MNTHGIHHDTNFQFEVYVWEVCSYELNSRKYVAVEYDNRPGQRHLETRKQEWVCAGYMDLSLAEAARETARRWMSDRRTNCVDSRGVIL